MMETTEKTCYHDLARCDKPVVMWTHGFYVHHYYCADHIPVGFNGVIPESLRIENEPDVEELP